MISRADRAAMDELLARSRDPEVHERVWDFIEGKIGKHELYRDRGVARELSAWYAEVLAAAREQGFDPDQVRRDVEEHGAERPPLRWEDRHAVIAELREEIEHLKG